MYGRPLVWVTASFFFHRILVAFRRSLSWICRAHATLIRPISSATRARSCARSKASMPSGPRLDHEKISLGRGIFHAAHFAVAMGISGKNLVASLVAVSASSRHLPERRDPRRDTRPRHRDHHAPAPVRLYYWTRWRTSPWIINGALEFVSRHDRHNLARLANVAERLLGSARPLVVRPN